MNKFLVIELEQILRLKSETVGVKLEQIFTKTNFVKLPSVIEQNSDIAETAKTQEKETISQDKKTQATQPEPDDRLKRDYDQIISYLKENYQSLADEYDNPHIITDDDDWGKLVQIIQAFTIYDFTIKSDQLSLGKKTLPNHLLIIIATTG